MTSLEEGRSIHGQERRSILRLTAIIFVVSLIVWVVGCHVSDLDLHVREGALYDRSVGTIVSTNK